MIKVAILCPYPVGEAPSQRFRVEQYLSWLGTQHIHTTSYPFLSSSAWEIFYQSNKPLAKSFQILLGFIRRFMLLARLMSVDFVFIHREAAPVGPPIFEWLIAKVLRKRIVYDFDDAIWLPNYSKQHRFIHRLKAYWKVKFIIRWAYRVSVGNEFLASYAVRYNARVDVIPTTIDMDYHALHADPTRSNVPIIGWTGTHTTVDYLKPIVPALEKLAAVHAFEFVVISNEPPSFLIPNLRFVRWNKSTEIEDLSQFSIGVMPLEDTEWAKGKCGFKALQYMALGIPTIAANVGVNSSIITHGQDGFIAQTTEDWFEFMNALLSDPSRGRMLGANAQACIRNRFSVQANQEKYRSLFTL